MSYEKERLGVLQDQAKRLTIEYKEAMIRISLEASILNERLKEIAETTGENKNGKN